MIERERAIPFGKSMPERYCRFLGYVGALRAMAAIGQDIEADPLRPTVNQNATRLRHLCKMLGDDKLTDARVHLENAHLNYNLEMMATHIGFLRPVRRRETALHPKVMDGHLTMAFDYLQGESGLYVPADKVAPLERIFEYYTDQAVHQYRAIADITVDQTEAETDVISRTRSEIQYFSMSV